jgi:hypothetical protein
VYSLSKRRHTDGPYGQEQLAVEQGVEVVGRVAQVHRDDAVVLLADGPAVLPLHAGRLDALLGVAGGAKCWAGRWIRKEVAGTLKLAGKKYGPETVAKALADLTATGELVDSKDKKGYRMPEWKRREGTESVRLSLIQRI